MYYPHSFTFSREDVLELNDDKEYLEEISSDKCDPDRNELFVKSRVFYDENQETVRNRKEGSPRKINNWRTEASDYRIRQDDVRLRDRQFYKKKEKKKEDVPIWTVPPQ